jgi:hypothetical protein
VQVKEGPEPEVYVAFNPRFEQIWLESRKRLPEYMEQKPANASLRSQSRSSPVQLGKEYVGDGTKSISLENLRKVLGLESIKDAEGNVIKEAPLPVWANFQQRALDALDVAILEVNTKTDLKIKLSSIERAKHRRVVALTFAIKTQAIPKRRPQ